MCYRNIPNMGIFKLIILLTLVPAGYSFSNGAEPAFKGDPNVSFAHIKHSGATRSSDYEVLLPKVVFRFYLAALLEHYIPKLL
jgi:hypothetical protein